PPAPIVDVWLMRDGLPGAEEAGNDIYLYAIGQDRAPAEWLREIAHEYSHLTLPVVGPFTSPERWGNGYLGERLLMQWLIRAAPGHRLRRRSPAVGQTRSAARPGRLNRIRAFAFRRSPRRPPWPATVCARASQHSGSSSHPAIGLWRSKGIASRGRGSRSTTP